MEAKRRVLMFFSYVGTSFRGSQIQLGEGHHNVKTVQQAIEEGLKTVYRLPGERPIRVLMGSRTDIGVHALKAVLCADLPADKFKYPDSLKYYLNSYFSQSEEIRIAEVYYMPDSFRLNSSMLGKTYIYRVGLLKQQFFDSTRKFVVPMMEVGRTHLIALKRDFDLNKAEEATELFKGEKDFGAIVGRPSKNTKPTICHIKSFTVEEAKPLVAFDPLNERYNFYQFTCKGNRFLFHMVRRMVSLSLSVGFNLLTLSDIEKLFDDPVPSSWPRKGVTEVSGHGLYLVNVDVNMEQTIKVPSVELFENEKISENVNC